MPTVPRPYNCESELAIGGDVFQLSGRRAVTLRFPTQTVQQSGSEGNRGNGPKEIVEDLILAIASRTRTHTYFRFLSIPRKRSSVSGAFVCSLSILFDFLIAP